MGNESETWKAVSGREDPWIRTRAGLCYWTDLCSSEDFPILTTAFQHKAVHMGTWHQDTLGRNLIIDFVVAVWNLRPHVSETRVRREGAQLSSDHRRVVCWLR